MKRNISRIISVVLCIALLSSVFTVNYISAATASELQNSINELEAQSKKLEGEIKRVEGKLNNAGFMAKAPEKLVAEEREKGEKYKEMLDKVMESINAMKNL